MCKNESIENSKVDKTEIKGKIIRDNFLVLNNNIEEIAAINCILKSLYRSVHFDDYTSEKISSFEIAEVLRKSHREIETLINCMNDKTDTLGYEFNEAFEESKEDKKRLARTAYAFINNGEIERAKKELEKVFMA